MKRKPEKENPIMSVSDYCDLKGLSDLVKKVAKKRHFGKTYSEIEWDSILKQDNLI